MHTQTLKQLAQGLKQKKFSSLELTQHYLQRIQQQNPSLNCFITRCEQSALAHAKQADKERAQEQTHPLHGIPIAHKDIFCTQGIRTSCGSKMLDHFISPYESTVTAKCQAAGMIMLGKTNMDEFAMGSSNETSFYGAVKNPWDLTTVPGGSSGGSAATVAARLAPIATGTDTGGSIRQPASLCGITGLKPTYGRVSRYGMIAFASSLDQAGPMAQTAEDAALLLQVISGFDPKDATSLDKSVPNFSETLEQPIQGLRIGLPKEYFNAQLDTTVAKTIHEALSVYESMGASLHEISLPHTALSLSSYYIIAPAECSSNLSRFDGVRFGHRCKDPKDLQDLYCRTRAEGFGEEVKRRILMGTYALSSGFYDAYYLKAQKIRQCIKHDFMEAFKTVDVIMSPTAPSTAFALGEKNKDPISMYLSDTFTIATNLAGLPALSIPAGQIQNKPIGLQLIGPYFSEGHLLQAAHQFQKNTAWHTQHPNDA